MEEDSTNYANAEFLARFKELFNRTEDQSGDQDYVSSSQNLDDQAVGFSTSLNPNTIWAWSVLRNEGINLLNSLLYFCCLTVSRETNRQFVSGSDKDYVFVTSVENLPGTNGQQNGTSYPTLSLPDPYSQETGMDYSVQIKLMKPNQMIRVALEFSGSWFLRNALAENNTESTNIIFDGLIGYVLNLAVHPSGCNVLLTLTQACNVDQLSQIIRNLILPPSRIIQVSLNLTG